MTAYRQQSTLSPLARLSFNSFWLLSTRIISMVLAMLFTLSIARSLGEEAFGSFAFITSVIFIGNVFSTFGLDTLLIRDVATARAAPSALIQSTVSAVLILQLALAAIFMIAVWVIGPRLPNQSADTLPALRLSVLCLIPLAFSTVYSAILRSYERMGAYLWFSVITALTSALGGWLIWLRGGSLTAAVGVILVAQIMGAVTAYSLCRFTVREHDFHWFVPERAIFIRAWRIGTVLAALMIFSVLYQRLGIILLSLVDTNSATGIYTAANRVLEALKLIPGAFFGALFPVMAATRHSTTKRTYTIGYAALLGLSVVLAALTATLARPIILLLYGPSYEEAIAPLCLMSWSLPLTVLSFKLSFDLVIQGNERVATLSIILTLGLAAAITAWMINLWSLTGAAAALLISETIQVIILALLTVGYSHRKAYSLSRNNGHEPAALHPD